jgi:FkbM family methyltransferase
MIRTIQNLLLGLRDLMPFDNGWQVLLNRSLFRREGLTVYRLGRLSILIDHEGGDQNGTRACLAGDMYSRYFHHLSKVGPLRVLDLGANGGGLPLALWHHGFALGEVACVEMNPATFTRLQFNLLANAQSTRVHLIHGAAFSTDGELTLNLGQGSTGDTLFAANEGSQVTIPTLTLDSLIGRSLGDGEIDLCKIDIESAEHDLLLEGPIGRLRQVRYLIIEIHPRVGRTRAALVAHILEQGFVEVSSIHETDGDCTVHLFRNASLT